MTSVVAAAAAAWAPRFVDIGANLLDPMFQGIYNGSSKHPGDLEAVLDRARARGVEVRWPLAKLPRRPVGGVSWLTVFRHPWLPCPPPAVAMQPSYSHMIAVRLHACMGVGELGCGTGGSLFKP